MPSSKDASAVFRAENGELERLSASSERAATTMTNLDGWAAQIREILKGQ